MPGRDQEVGRNVGANSFPTCLPLRCRWANEYFRRRTFFDNRPNAAAGEPAARRRCAARRPSAVGQLRLAAAKRGQIGESPRVFERHISATDPS